MIACRCGLTMAGGPHLVFFGIFTLISWSHILGTFSDRIIPLCNSPCKYSTVESLYFEALVVQSGRLLFVLVCILPNVFEQLWLNILQKFPMGDLDVGLSRC